MNPLSSHELAHFEDLHRPHGPSFRGRGGESIHERAKVAEKSWGAFRTREDGLKEGKEDLRSARGKGESDEIAQIRLTESLNSRSSER